jgi:hypothetical protein
MSSLFLDVAAVLGLSFLSHCCVYVTPEVSSRTSILLGFHIQHHFCLVPDHVPCVVQEWHGQSTLLR